MKKHHLTTWVLLSFLSFQTHAQIFGIGGDREPKELENLKKQKMDVPLYESFDEIAPVTPVPGKFRLKLGAVLRMVVFRKEEIQYEIVTPKESNQLERTIQSFFKETGTENSLKLLHYARQINAEHPYRTNPFVTFFTMRSENRLIGDEKVGPAAVVADLFKQRGTIEGPIQYFTPQGSLRQADVRYREKSVPQSGLLFLFDHDVFSLNDLIQNPKENILQDVILHEFTHIWHNELLNSKNKARNTVGSNMTENGHDTMIVTNPTLGFSEGLAIGFEALYGSKASQLLNLSADERRQFFGRFTGEARGEMEFLVNRQGYVRRNSYIYNLYDFNECTLRVVDTPSAATIGNQKLNFHQIWNSVTRGEEVDLEILRFAWDNFNDRFYAGSDRVSTVSLMRNCQEDSPARLESKEGFLATLIYNLVYSGAFVDSSRLDFHLLGQTGDEARAQFKSYLTQANQWEADLQTSGRAVASTNPRVVEAERIFLLGFRNLVKAIKGAQAITTTDFLHYILSPKSPFDDGIKLKVAYQVMKVTKGAWFQSGQYSQETVRKYFATPAAINSHSHEIYDFLTDLVQTNKLTDTVASLGKSPEIYISFPSELSSGRSRRININLAYHIDLIDMFGMNNKAIVELARKLNAGPAFKNEAEFVAFAQGIGKGEEAKKWLAQAAKEIAEVRKLESQFTFQELRNPHL